jgi:hypothetical protein
MKRSARYALMLFCCLVIGLALQQVGYCDCDNDYFCEPENAESPQNCPVDCNCGNSTCDLGEDRYSCPGDCPPTCGDGVCDVEYGETIYNCLDDCHCGDGTCEPEYGEANSNCSDDCFCGDGFCYQADNENNYYCPDDCNLSFSCNNGINDTCEPPLEAWWNCLDCLTEDHCTNGMWGIYCVRLELYYQVTYYQALVDCQCNHW